MGSRSLRLGVLALGLATFPGTAQEPAAAPLLLRGIKVLPMDQPAIDGGEVLLQDGKIAAVGKQLEPPPGTRVLEYADGWIVPGFVELHCHVGGSGSDTNDMVLPHNMDLRTLDALRQQNPELDRAAAAGVTTALCIPGSGSSIGGLGTLVKTKGPSFEQRLVRFPGALKIALHARGGNPSRNAGDLGSSRLGLHWMLRQIMAEAKDYHEACVAHERGHAPKPQFSPRLDPLRGLFRGEFPCILHAYGADDTMTAVRILHWGLGIPIVISHGEYESFVVGKELAAIGVPLNIGPTLYEFTEGKVLGNASELYFAGVRTSLCTDSPVVAQEELPLQASMACRLGLPSEEALRGITLAPAVAIGIGNRVGSLTPGKDADVVVCTGDPLDPRNAPVLVVIDGRIVHEAGSGTRQY
jgi:imidazolonepropionase-like amidohydrolase